MPYEIHQIGEKIDRLLINANDAEHEHLLAAKTNLISCDEHSPAWRREIAQLDLIANLIGSRLILDAR